MRTPASPQKGLARRFRGSDLVCSLWQLWKTGVLLSLALSLPNLDQRVEPCASVPSPNCVDRLDGAWEPFHRLKSGGCAAFRIMRFRWTHGLRRARDQTSTKLRSPASRRMRPSTCSRETKHSVSAIAGHPFPRRYVGINAPGVWRASDPRNAAAERRAFPIATRRWRKARRAGRCAGGACSRR